MGYSNRYEARCVYCAGTVPANEGDMWKWKGRYYVCHKECGEQKKAERQASKSSGVDIFVIGGKEYTRNKKGRCEDAPCCGCCTI